MPHIRLRLLLALFWPLILAVLLTAARVCPAQTQPPTVPTPIDLTFNISLYSSGYYGGFIYFYTLQDAHESVTTPTLFMNGSTFSPSLLATSFFWIGNFEVADLLWGCGSPRIGQTSQEQFINLTGQVGKLPFGPAITFVPATSGQVSPAVPIVYQTNSQWSGDYLNGLYGQTIGNYGCALTSLDMALLAAGKTTLPDGTTPLNPGTLNTFLMFAGTGAYQGDGLFAGDDLVFANAVAAFGGSVQWSGKRIDGVQFPATANNYLQTQIDNGYPVIVGVYKTQADYNNGHIGHYVLVTGYQGSTFYINDPAAKSSNPTLDIYYGFETRGYVYHYPLP